MLRFVAFDAIFFLIPFAAYALWLVVTRRALPNAADWEVRTIGYLALAGAVLVLGVLIAFVHFDAEPPGGVYVPAQLENGKIVPGHFEPATRP
jgi:hypothetical protein